MISQVRVVKCPPTGTHCRYSKVYEKHLMQLNVVGSGVRTEGGFGGQNPFPLTIEKK